MIPPMYAIQTLANVISSERVKQLNTILGIISQLAIINGVYSIDVQLTHNKVKTICHRDVLNHVISSFSSNVTKVKRIRGNLYIVEIKYGLEEKIKGSKGK